MSNRTFVIGVGMTKFEKPGTKEGDYPDWAKEAGEKALADAGIPYEDVEQAYAGYCYGDSTYGQRALYQLGLTGIPVVNVNNNCSTGSSALFLARQAVKGGLVDCALALGFEKMEPGCSASSTPTAPTRSTSTRCGCSRSATPSSRRRRRRCSATPAATTWRSTAPTPTTTPGSAGRTTSTRSTTPTPSSRTSTRSRTSRRRR